MTKRMRLFVGALALSAGFTASATPAHSTVEAQAPQSELIYLPGDPLAALCAAAGGLPRISLLPGLALGPVCASP